MRIGGTHYRTIWMDDDPGIVKVIDQRFLPFEFKVKELRTAEDAFYAIRDMVVRGAPLIGVSAAFGLYLAARNSRPDRWCDEIKEARTLLNSARPTAVNLNYALDLAMTEVDCAASREGIRDRLFHLAMRLA